MGEPYEPLYTAAEMRAAEERYPGYPDSIPELMEQPGQRLLERRCTPSVCTELRVRLRRRVEQATDALRLASCATRVMSQTRPMRSTDTTWSSTRSSVLGFMASRGPRRPG